MMLQDLGALFHQQLERFLPEDNHPDDPVHNLAVGEALLKLHQGEPPAIICATYNAWAEIHGYAPILFLGWWLDLRGDLWIGGDIGTALIAVRTIERADGLDIRVRPLEETLRCQ